MNRLSKKLGDLENYPIILKKWFVNYIIGNSVKMVGTCGLKFTTLEPNRVVVNLQNKSKIQNHIGQIHAAASTLLAETATGIIVGLSIPDDKIPLMKNLAIKFIKRSEGFQQATASLTNDQILKIQTEEKGDIMVPVKVIDQTGAEVILAEMNWAWIPKKKNNLK